MCVCVCVCVCVENTAMASSIKNDLFVRVYVCMYMLGKSIESMCPLLAEVKRIKIDFTYIHVYDRK